MSARRDRSAISSSGDAIRCSILSVAVAVLAFSDAQDADQSAPSSGSMATEKLQEVTVTAQRAKLAFRVQQFVKQIVAPENKGADGIGRWQPPPALSGLRAIGRISPRAPLRDRPQSRTVDWFANGEFK